MKGEWRALTGRRTKPYRMRTEAVAVSQTFNDGIVKIYEAADKSAPGRQPVPELTLCEQLFYAELKLGITRYYAAKQDNAEIKRVIRVAARPTLHSGQIAVTENGERYRVDLVQLAAGIYPKSFDLTLCEIKQTFGAGGET